MIKVTKKIHEGYAEYQSVDKICKKKGIEIPFKNHFGKYHYLYEDDKGNKISLVYLSMFDENWWEIYDGNKLFVDTQRFNSKKEAEKKIKQLLNRK
jgi:hypothetical protein